MRILILNFILSTAVNGKIIRRESNRDTMIHTMARGFLKLGHSVTLAAAEEFRPTGSDSDTGFETVYFRSRMPRLFKPALLPWPEGLGKYLRRNAGNFDMILSVDTFSFPTIIAARNCRGKLLIWQEMAFMQHMMGGLPAKLWYNLIAPRFIKEAPVVAQSGKARDFIRRYLPTVSDTIVGHGSDSDLFFPADKSENYFVVISMLVARKQIDRIIAKFARFLEKRSDKDFRLRIIGEGPELDHLRRETERLGISDNVSFEGFMSHREIADIGRKAKALLIDTRQDNNMVTIPEAIVNGTPILTNLVPNNASFIISHGLGIAKNDWDHEDLQMMVDNYGQFHKNCVAARRHYSNDGCAATLANIFLHPAINAKES